MPIPKSHTLPKHDSPATIEESIRAGNDTRIATPGELTAPLALPAAGPPSLDPKALMEVAMSVSLLDSAVLLEDAARKAELAAKEKHDSAQATLDAARARCLKAFSALAGENLSDNFIAITDDEGRQLAADALKAKRGVVEHARALLFGKV